MPLRDRGTDRRRFAIGYILSILIHLVVIALASIVTLHALRDESSQEYAPAEDVVVRPFPSSAPTPVAQLRPRPAPPHELARAAPSSTPQPPPRPATAPPIAIPTPAVAVAPELRPLVVLTAIPRSVPTIVATAVPTVEPTVEPTIAPTPVPTIAPTPIPTIAPTTIPTIAPTPVATIAPTTRPTTPPTVAPSATPIVAASASGAQRIAAQPTGAPPAPAVTARPVPPPPTAPPATATPTAPATAAASVPASSLDNLNARLRQLSQGTPVNYTQKRIALGNNVAQDVLDAYEKALAPPAEILARTFGLIWTTRTVVHADSVAYVYERTHDVLGREVCKAYRITEHPLRSAPVRFNPDKAQFPAPLPNATPLIETVNVSCNDSHMQPVVPGSLKSPVPRHSP